MVQGHIAGMEPLAKCVSVLRPLIAQASDLNAIILAEKAVDEYLNFYQTGPTKIGAIAILQQALTPLWRAGDRPQVDLINTIVDYLEQHMRELREPS